MIYSILYNNINQKFRSHSKKFAGQIAKNTNGRKEKPLDVCEQVKHEAILERIKSFGPNNPIEFQIAHKKRELFSMKSFPYGIRDGRDAKNLVKKLLPGERKLVFDALRKKTVDQYMEHKRLGNAEVHSDDLVKLWYIYYIPAYCFAFVDNAFLIVLGEQIDEHFGAYLGISIIGAAAVSNIFVNLMGMNVSLHVESLMSRFYIRRPILSAEQWNNREVRFLIYIAKICGIVTGCIFGMFPLLLLNAPTRTEILERETVEVDIKGIMDDEDPSVEPVKSPVVIDGLSNRLFSSQRSTYSMDYLHAQAMQDLSDEYRQQSYGAHASDKGI